MTGLDELRLTLDRRAHDLHDDHAVGRVGEIHARVSRVRRRRTAVAGVAAALVIGAAGTVALLPDGSGPVPAERELIGLQAPETLESLGYTYEFATAVSTDDAPRVLDGLSPSEEPRLVTWATAGQAQRVVVRGVGMREVTSEAADFADFVLVPPGFEGDVSVRGEQDGIALAVYELTGPPPGGVTVDGLTFREQVGADRLFDAVVGEPGDTDVSMEVTLPGGRVRVAEYCTGVPGEERLWVNVSVGEEGATASDGCSDDGFDPGSQGQGAWYEPGELGQPGETVTLRTWVSPRLDGPAVDPMPGVRLGLALYQVPEPAAVVAGWDVPELKEHDGRLWRFVGTELGARGQGQLQVRNDTDEVLLAVGSFSDVGTGRVAFLAGPGEGVIRSSSGGSGSDLRALLEPGDPPARLRVRAETSPEARLGFALYERVD